MSTRTIPSLVCLAAVYALLSCSSGTDDEPVPMSRLHPTPQISAVEVGGGIAVRHAASVQLAPEGHGGASHALAAANVSSLGFGGTPLDQLADAIPGNIRLSPISTENPQNLLGLSVDNELQPHNDPNMKLLEGFRGWALPTGSWAKAFFYQSPSNLDAYFLPKPIGPDDPPDPRNNSDVGRYNVFAFPNKLNLDDRIGMVSVTFPQRNYVAVDTNPDSPVYDLRNPYRASFVMFHTATDGGQDVRLNYLADGVGRLPRRVDRLDELSISTSWMNATEDRGMQVVAAQGSPYVTVRYIGVRPVIQVGEGLRVKRDKDAFFNDIIGTEKYDEWESDNRIVAVATDENPLQSFVETGPVNARVTPSLTGAKFRFAYRAASLARAPLASNDNAVPPPVPLVYKEMVVYTSHPVTLDWDVTLRAYVMRDNFHGVVRAAYVDDVLQSAPGVTATNVSDQPGFKQKRALLDQYAMTYPVAAEIVLHYEGAAVGEIQYHWLTQRMDLAPPQDADLLMLGFDATHIPSLRNPQRVAISYPSNFGAMSGVAGSQWVQQLTIPAILRNGASEQDLWFGPRSIKTADRALLQASLQKDAEIMREYITNCNYESYLCGKYFHNLARLILIADQLGDSVTRNQLLAFLKPNLQQWFEQAAPGPDGTPDFFVFDRINRGVITLHGFMDYEADFNNGAYNDHMFHYGYFIYAAAVLSRYDSQWFNQNREKVNTLVRDIANPSLNDPYFPLMRTFDWFRLQNFADSGPDANGANTESSSESIHANYALALWGTVLNNSQFQALAAIMTAAEIRTAQAFYQVTPGNSVFKDVPGPTVMVKLPNGASASQVLAPAEQPVMGIIRQGASETNIFFGPRQDFRIGIQLLPITPLSEYLISPQWATQHSAFLLDLETANTRLFDDIINNVPNDTSACFTGTADLSKPNPVKDDQGNPAPWNIGAICTTPLRTLYSWRQLISAANGVNNPGAAYNRYAGYVERLESDEARYRANTDSVTHPGSSLNAGGIVADVLKDVSTPSLNTNTLWWLSSRKP